jgi:hypothetical protein
MLHNDIINPLVDDFITRVTGQGINFFNGAEITRLNDFVEYLCSIVPDRKFAFYPFRISQNIGVGNRAFGIGELASGTPVVFPGLALWNESGIQVGSNVQVGGRFGPIYQTSAIINFSGNVEGDFQFRKDESTIFYFFKHLRSNEYARSLYRGNAVCPYFVCDNSPDWFQVIAPQFSDSRFRPQGTTYIYDEIFGEDKKGFQMDWSEKETQKYYGPQSISFYDPELGSTPNRFYCFNVGVNFDNYTLKSFYGRDERLYSGKFVSPYVRREIRPGVYDYDLPRRIVIGAGCTNLASKVYNLEGLDHLVPGILIIKGNYSNFAEEIAFNMGLTVGAIDESFPALLSGISDTASKIVTANITELDYYRVFPIEYKGYPKEFSNITATIASIFVEDFGKWEWFYDPLLCGQLGCFGGWPGRSPVEKTQINSNITSGLYLTGYQSTGTYGSLRLGESLSNNGILGFWSGYRDVSGNFSGFNRNTISGYSGFYYNNNTIVFPPYRKFEIDKITGYISGIMDSAYNFRPFNSSEQNYGSGYFLDSQQIDFTYTGSVQVPISGFLSGYLDPENGWSGFDLYNLNSQSGYYIGNNKIEFSPIKVIKKSPVTGFWVGFMDGFGKFSGYTSGDGLSGVLLTNNVESNDPIDRYFYPSGGDFVGFENIDGLDITYGYEYSGFFFGNSGFIGEDPNNPFLGIGEMTGFIGYKNILTFSGTFLGKESITGIDDGYGYEYSGFFDGGTGFSGIEFDFLANQFKNYGTGILYGYIGSKNILKYYSDEGFVGRSGFNEEDGYKYTGFSFPEGSGFSGINNQPTGSGVITGFIGSRNFVYYTGVYSGFSGLLENYNQYLPRVVYADFNFTRGSGFLGNSASGYGLLTGIISKSNIDGEFAYFGDVKITSGRYFTGWIGTGITLTGIPGGVLDYSLTNISGNISGVSYTLAIISGGTFEETGVNVSGTINNVNYLSGFLEIGTGLQTGFIAETGTIQATISSVTLTEAIAVLFATDPIEQSSLTASVPSVNYEEAVRSTGFSTEYQNISGSITSLYHYTYSRNDFTGIESGGYSVTGLYRINTGIQPITGESASYSISGRFMVVPLYFESVNYSLSGISMTV